MFHTKKLIPALACAAVMVVQSIASAQTPVPKEKVVFKADTLVEGHLNVSADLAIPGGAPDKKAAVVVVHSAGGYEDGTRKPYVDALNQAGIATLELNLYPQGGRPKTSRMNLPHVFGGLIYLANHPGIDSARIGIMGFSAGGLLSMLSASSEMVQEFTGGKYRFAAHLPVYPVCWAHLGSIQGKNPVYKISVYQTLTGAPVHMLAGDKDDYDDPDTCVQFLAALSPDARQHVALTVYPNAPHGWDSLKSPRSYYDTAANKGRGGNVQHYRQEDAAQKSLAFTLDFFKTKLGVN